MCAKCAEKESLLSTIMPRSRIVMTDVKPIQTNKYKYINIYVYKYELDEDSFSLIAFPLYKGLTSANEA